MSSSTSVRDISVGRQGPHVPSGGFVVNMLRQIVVASSDLENRRALTSILTRQGFDPISISSFAECRELIEKEAVGLLFCDQHLADGDYRDVLNASRTSTGRVHVVVISKHANWDEYLEAMRLGAFDVIASPCRPTDVEWMVIQARRDERNRSRERLTASAPPAPLANDLAARHAAVAKTA